MFKYLIVLFTLILISLNLQSQPTIKLKLNICEWRFKDCGRVMIDGCDYDIRAMNTIEYESLYEVTLYTNEKHIVTIQRAPTTYYFNVLYPNGDVTCDEYERNLLIDWIFKIFILP